MPIAEIIVPQIGEGLREALITALLKAPADAVERDETIFEMETDKATVSVESAYRGTLREWIVAKGDVVPVGAVVARIEVEDVAETAAGVDTDSDPTAVRVAVQAQGAAKASGVRIPPRTRAHCRRLGISEEEMVRIPAPSGKLMPQDVDRYWADRTNNVAQRTTQPEPTYRDRRLPAQQRALVYRLRRSAQWVIPASIMLQMPLNPIERAQRAFETQYPEAAISTFETLAYCVALAARSHAAFRSVLLSDDAYREYEHVNLGIAVQCPGNEELVTAMVPRADTMAFPAFVHVVQERVACALEGDDQADDTMQLLLTFMGDNGITHAVPTLVAPAIATLFMGAPYATGRNEGRFAINLSLTFDHRLINGAGAANFLNAIAREVKSIGDQSHLVGQDLRRQPDAAADIASIRIAVLSAREKERASLLETHVRELVARRLSVSVAEIDPSKPLRRLGLNSLQSVELSNSLQNSLRVSVPPTLVWNYPTVRAIARHLTGSVEDGQAPDPTENGDSHYLRKLAEENRNIDRLLNEIEGLSEDEVRRRLSEDEAT